MTQDDLTKLALIKLEQEQQARVDVITVNLMREGINKHRARELADHFVNFTSCIGKDPRCPCQDGDACHYKDCGGTKAWPVPKAEPVGEVTEVSDNGFKCEFNQSLAVGAKLYTTPPAPQREWVGLTEFQFSEIYNTWNDSNGSTPWGLYHAIEKALKAKNHG